MYKGFIQNQLNFCKKDIYLAWFVHLLTSVGVICGFFALKNKIDREIFKAFIWLGLSLMIDGIDGPIARFLKVDKKLPHIDSHMLDSIVDYINIYFYTRIHATPFKHFTSRLKYSFPNNNYADFSHFVFKQNTKTVENNYVGFPAIWNIVIFYLAILDTNPILNVSILLFLIILKFLPVQFVHPFRTEKLRRFTLLVNISWVVLTTVIITIKEYHYHLNYFQNYLFLWSFCSFCYIYLTCFLNFGNQISLQRNVKKLNLDKILSLKTILSTK